jgi:hypothetical protein
MGRFIVPFEVIGRKPNAIVGKSFHRRAFFSRGWRLFVGNVVRRLTRTTYGGTRSL